MKKRTILCSIAAVAAVSGIIGYANRYQSPQLSELGLANMEALSGLGDEVIETCNDVCEDYKDESCSADYGGIPVTCHQMRTK
ncbi:MAG: NVEALA domain-containing protein [Bacteroides sp.]|nr:NVEALA domain-containing protein [Bacteroides sp.]MCM1388863.1 NVEALA domain-containing protein [Bacteroides sp.]